LQIVASPPITVAGNRAPARASATRDYEVESFDGTKKGVVKF